MPENVGLYCVQFPMGPLLIPEFWGTGNYTGTLWEPALAPGREKNSVGTFSLLFSSFSFHPLLSSFHFFCFPAPRKSEIKEFAKGHKKGACVCWRQRTCIQLAFSEGKNQPIKNVTLSLSISLFLGCCVEQAGGRGESKYLVCLRVPRKKPKSVGISTHVFFSARGERELIFLPPNILICIHWLYEGCVRTNKCTDNQSTQLQNYFFWCSSTPIRIIHTMLICAISGHASSLFLGSNHLSFFRLTLMHTYYSFIHKDLCMPQEVY